MRTRLVVATVALIAAGCSSTGQGTADETDAPRTTIAATTTVKTAIPEPAPDAAIAVVASALDAKNSGDLDRWLATHKDGKSAGTPLFAEEILMNANQVWEVVEPCQVTGGTATGDTVVECLIKDINDFWAVGGISDTKTQTFTVNEDGLITGRKNIFGSSRRDSFNASFHIWLSGTYPDVYSDAGFPVVPSRNGPGFNTADPELMLIAVEYVEEFVAQSDTYPLNPADQ